MYTSTHQLRGAAVPSYVKLQQHHTPRHRHVLTVAASYCPYRTLGVSETANDKEIKTAYRKLALRYHPDISTASDADAKFISIQEAYNILTGKSRGKETGPQNPSSSDWDFHDWYWQFRMSRSWDRQKGGSPKPPTQSAGHQHAESKEGIRTQLAGLRHRAAIRKVQQQNMTMTADFDSDDESEAVAKEPISPTDPEACFEAADIADGANYTTTSEAGKDAWQQQKPKFVATENRRAQVFSQLNGLKRKGKLKQQQQQQQQGAF